MRGPTRAEQALRADDHAVTTTLVPSPVTVRVVRPIEPSAEPLPLLLLLHGGEGDLSLIDSLRDVFARAWAGGDLPPAVVAAPASGRSFWLDWRDGAQRWETFLLEELIPYLRRALPVRCDRRGTVVAGISMGGLGALRLAFHHPDRFVAVAALEPGIEPALEFAQVRPRHSFHRMDGSLQARFGDPIDPDHWRHNNPASIARDTPDALAASGLAVYLEAGDEDALHIDEGTEHLHRLLFDTGIPHEYRLVNGADHVGASLAPRMLDALRFLGRALRPRASGSSGGLSAGLFRRILDAPRAAASVDERRSPGRRFTTTVDSPGARLHVDVRGRGHDVLLLPSLGRGREDFSRVAADLIDAGFRVVLPQPRGIAPSTAREEPRTLHDLARDVAAVLEATCIRPATVIGHAFGSQVARALAADRPDLVRDLILVAAGGAIPPDPEAVASLRRVLDPDQPRETRLADLALAFFADPARAPDWLDGWHVEAAWAQAAASHATPIEQWWSGGRAPILVLQPARDRLAPIENAHRLRSSRVDPDSVTIVEIADAGHAALPERPELIVAAIVSYLDSDAVVPRVTSN